MRSLRQESRAGRWLLGAVLISSLVGLAEAAEAPGTNLTSAMGRALPEWQAMDYGPFFSASLEVAKGNIANKGIAVRLDPGPGGIARGHDFFLFDTDTLRAAAAWSGPGFIDWKNVALDGTHEVHASIVGERIFTNADAPGWADPNEGSEDSRIVGRDGQRYGPLPRSWAHWRGLFVHGQQVVLSYTVGTTEVLESPGLQVLGHDTRIFSRTFQVGPRQRPLVLQVAQAQSNPAAVPARQPFLVGETNGLEWVRTPGHLRLRLPAGQQTLRFQLAFPGSGGEEGTTLLSDALPDLQALVHGGPPHWSETVKTKVERQLDARAPYVVESITVPSPNPYRSWMRLGGFDFFKDGQRAAVCTWQGDVWIVDGLGGDLSSFTWKRIAAGLFQPLGLKIVDERIYVTCRDQITRLHDLNGDGETDFYENFNNDAQVTEHFHEFAMDLQTDSAGNFYYAKGGRHAKDALVPQHGTLLRVSKDGSKTDILANGFRAPNGVCVNDDGSYIVSDQEGHWTPENRINWVKPGGFYGYMMGYHEGRATNDFEPPVVWIHKSLDRSPAEQLWVTSDKWGLPQGALISLSYGTGKILGVLYERVGGTIQGGVYTLPVTPMPTGIMRGRFHPGDGQLYTLGLFGWAGDKTKPGGFYRVRYTGKPLNLPVALAATRQGLVIGFSRPLDRDSAADPENYAVSRWTYRRTANYGSDDYSLKDPDQRGRDEVRITGVKVSPDAKSVLLEIPDLQPCMQMEVKFNLEAANAAQFSGLIENTIHAVGADCPFAKSGP